MIMTSIELELPVRVIVSRENFPENGTTTSSAVDVKRIYLPSNLEVYINQQTGVLLVRPMEEMGDK